MFLRNTLKALNQHTSVHMTQCPIWQQVTEVIGTPLNQSAFNETNFNSTICVSHTKQQISVMSQHFPFLHYYYVLELEFSQIMLGY